jgi:hypothetical protein
VIPFLWPVHDTRQTVAWFLDYDAAVDCVNTTTDRELYIGEPQYDTPQMRARMTERLTARYFPSDQLTECRSDPLLAKRRAA